MEVDNAFVGQRALSLATVFLTRHPEVRVVHDTTDSGLDLQVQITHKGMPTGRMFGVEVKARMNLQRVGKILPDGRARLSTQLRNLVQKTGDQFALLPFPYLFMVFAMDRDQAFFGWLRQPNSRSSKLVSPKVEYGCPWLDKTHMDIVDAVKGWYADRNGPR